MPSYLYVCPRCGYDETIKHSMSEKVEPVCVDCTGKMQRKPQLGAVTFKGEGWAHKEGGK